MQILGDMMKLWCQQYVEDLREFHLQPKHMEFSMAPFPHDKAEAIMRLAEQRIAFEAAKKKFMEGKISQRRSRR
jgi:hypothetical protein